MAASAEPLIDGEKVVKCPRCLVDHRLGVLRLNRSTDERSYLAICPTTGHGFHLDKAVVEPPLKRSPAVNVTPRGAWLEQRQQELLSAAVRFHEDRKFGDPKLVDIFEELHMNAQELS
jgi:hypothetical protein